MRVARGLAADPARTGFDLWRIPGRKSLAAAGADLALTVETSALSLRVTLSGDLSDGAEYVCAVPLSPGLRGQLGAFDAQAQVLAGNVPRVAAGRPVTRAALLHLRALQALDAAQAGASQRDIAQALFGLEAVVRRWQADGELRAQVRHLLRRARSYMSGGYLDLVSLRRSPANECAVTPGDGPAR